MDEESDAGTLDRSTAILCGASERQECVKVYGLIADAVK